MFQIVTRWKEQRRAKASSLQALIATEQGGAIRIDEPFAVVIYCTSDPGRLDTKTRSKWSRALRYAERFKPDPQDLTQFIQSKGGINECADEANVALHQVTVTIPIVGALIVEPLRLGLAKSYNHPEYNLTGILVTIDTLPTKRLELLLELVPSAKKIGVLINPTISTQQDMLHNIETFARDRQMTVIGVDATLPSDLVPAFEILRRSGSDCLIFGPDLMFFTEVSRILKFAEETRTPAIYQFRQHVQRGGLMSYGVVTRENFRRAAYFVDRILKGARPSDLPIELPTKLELVINLKTAKTLGLTVPSKLLFTADEVIE